MLFVPNDLDTGDFICNDDVDNLDAGCFNANNPRKIINVLPDSLALCEDSTLFTNSNTTDSNDSDNAKKGRYATKVVLNGASSGDIDYNIFSLIDITKHWFVVAEMKNGDLSGSGVRLNLVSDVGNNAGTYVTATTYTRKGVKLQPDDLTGATSLNLAIELDGATTEFAYVDNLMFIEITAQEYALSEAVLLARFPFISSIGVPTYSNIIKLNTDFSCEDGRVEVILRGKSRSNPLPDNVAGCEVTAGFGASGVSLSNDSSNNLEGTNCIKATVTTGGNFTYNILSLLDNTKRYLITAHIKNYDATNIRLAITATGDVGTIDPNSSYTGTVYKRQGVVIEPSDFDGASDVLIDIRVNGSAGQYIFTDAIQIDEITVDDFVNGDTNGADVLFPKYPFKRGLKGTDIKRIKTIGVNYFDKTKVRHGYQADNTDGTDTISVGETVSDYIKIDRDLGYAISGCDNTTNTDGAFYNFNKEYIGGFTSYGALTIPIGTEYIRFTIDENDLDTAQLEVGSSGSAYEKFEETISFTPRKLLGMPNDINDSFNLNTGEDNQKCDIHTFVSGDITSLITSATNNDRVIITKPTTWSMYNDGANPINGSAVFQLGNGDSAFNDDTATIGKICNIDATTFAYVVGKGTYANLGAAQTAIAGKELHFALLPANYTTKFYKQNTINVKSSGSIFVENVIEEVGIYDSGNNGLEIANTNLTIQSLENLEKLDYSNLRADKIYLATSTIASNKLSFILSGSNNGDLVRYQRQYFGESSQGLLNYHYCRSAKDESEGNRINTEDLDKKINLIKDLQDFKTKSINIVLGSVSATTSQILFTAPTNCVLTNFDMVTKDDITANDTNYWTIALTNKGSDGSGSDTIASLTTEATGGQGFTGYDTWNIGSLDSAYTTFTKGDVVLLTLTKTASATAFAEALACLSYRET